MRVLAAVSGIVLMTATVAAADGWPVVVTTEQGGTIRGRLLSITEERVTLSRDGRLDTLPLDTVLRVVKPRDPIADGLLKGFAVGLVPLLLWGGASDSAFAARWLATYTLIGGAIDAAHGDAFVVYQRGAPQAPSRGRRVGISWTLQLK